MSRPGLLAALAATLGCSDITVTPGGVAAIELHLPHPAQIEVGQDRPLRGRAVGAAGDSLPVRLVWYVLDTTLAVDSAEGVLTGRAPGDGRVLARAADLYSRPAAFRVLRRVDSLVRVTPETLVVAAAEDATSDLRVRAAAGTELDPVAGRDIGFALTRPVFADTAARTVEFLNGRLATTAITGANGEPSFVRVRRRTGFPAPDTAVVTVTLRRPGGALVPGSGLTFVILFEAP